MAYIHAAPGVATREATVKIGLSTETAGALSLEIPALQDITINAANDVFTWAQLDDSAKKQIATTSTNSVSCNMVVDPNTFFGTGSTGDAAEDGLLKLSQDKTLVKFEIDLGDTSAKSIEGTGYITGLAPTTSADAPVWVTPITITVTGEYTLGTNVA